MYTQFFGLREKPFSITPDPRYLYMSQRHADALAHLIYGISQSGGFIQLTGEVGTGKTTLLHALLAQLDSSTDFAYIFNSRLEPFDFFQLLFDDLGIEETCISKADYLLVLNHYLIDRLKNDRTVLLIIDEAQNLSPEMLEEIRLLSNLETPNSKLIQILLVGQPELSDMLDRDDLRQLRQRIVLRHVLKPFDARELEFYVEERLRLAGYTGKGIFKRSALRELFAVTGGVPRLVNVVCDGALLTGYGRDQATLGAEIIREVANDLHLNPTPKTSAGETGSGGRGSSKRRRGWLGLFR